MLRESTRIVDRGFTFLTASFCHENVTNFGRSAVTRSPCGQFEGSTGIIGPVLVQCDDFEDCDVWSMAS